MNKLIITILILITTGCATTGNQSTSLGKCQENGVLMDEENPNLVNCSEIDLFVSKQENLKWHENTYKANLVKEKELEINFIYSPDGRYYVLVSGQSFNIPKAQGTLTINPTGDSPEHISLAAEQFFLSGVGVKRSGKTLFKLSLKVPKEDMTSYEAKFKFELNL